MGLLPTLPQLDGAFARRALTWADRPQLGGYGPLVANFRPFTGFCVTGILRKDKIGQFLLGLPL